jgi:hypothetical protein
VYDEMPPTMQEMSSRAAMTLEMIMPTRLPFGPFSYSRARRLRIMRVIL